MSVILGAPLVTCLLFLKLPLRYVCYSQSSPLVLECPLLNYIDTGTEQKFLTNCFTIFFQHNIDTKTRNNTALSNYLMETSITGSTLYFQYIPIYDRQKKIFFYSFLQLSASHRPPFLKHFHAFFLHVYYFLSSPGKEGTTSSH